MLHSTVTPDNQQRINKIIKFDKLNGGADELTKPDYHKSTNMSRQTFCVRGMRWPVEIIIDMLGAGMSIEEISVDHPELEKEDILACLQYAKLSLSGHTIKEVA